MINLSNYGVASIDTEEMKETNGGGILKEIFKIIAGEIAVEIIKNIPPLSDKMQEANATLYMSPKY